MVPPCSYFGCKTRMGQKPMFHFPLRDPQRLQIWIKNCGNMTITHLPEHELRNKFLCLDHFKKKFIQNENGKRTRISRLAIPDHYQDEQLDSPVASTSTTHQSQDQGSPELKVLTPKKVYKGVKNRETKVVEEFEDTEIYTTPKKRKRQADEETPKCKRLKLAIQNTQKKLKKERMKNRRLRKKSNENLVDLNKVKFNSDASQTLTLMQLKKGKKQWTESEKIFCMSLYYKSPAAYKHMRNQGIVLAAPNTIQKWLQATDCLPGINDDVFKNISMKFADQSIKEKSCIVCFDEMSIKVDLDYTMKFDFIEGFEDFGGGDRSPKEAKYALVFVARGIYSNWKIPLAYFLAQNNVNADKLINLIKSVINKLFDSGLLPKAVVCDQATTNVKAIKSLGATKDDPFFFIDNHKLFAIYDVPHLIKNVRNNLIDHNFDLNGYEISFKDIIDLYNIDIKNKSRTVRKLTPVHLNPNNFQKMKVKYATQVLSHSVGAAMKTAIDSGELQNGTAKNTADFVMIMNDLFDSLNSKNKFDNNPFKCALTKNEKSRVNQILNKGFEMFSDLKKQMIGKNNKIKYTRPPCFEGMQQTIKAVQQLSTEEFSQGTEVKFIMTYRFNQDIIENLFGIYRMRGGCNRNPTSKSLRATFRSHLLNNLIKLDNTNCELDNDTFLTTTTNLQNTQSANRLTTTTTTCSSLDCTTINAGAGPSYEGASICESSQMLTPEIAPATDRAVSLETCSVVYFAGWLGKVCVEKFDCSICRQALINNEVDLSDSKQLLLINKTYSNLIAPTLKSPSAFLSDLVDRVLDLFKERIDYLHEMDLLTNLVAKVNEATNYLDDYHDSSHLEYLIKKLLQVKIHDYCKSKKSAYDSKSKLKVLRHK